MSEIWKDIPDYEGYYQVSNMGRVRSVDRYVTRKFNHGIVKDQFYKGQLLTPITDKDGYQIVSLAIAGNSKMCKVHRLMCLAFYGECPKNKQVAHNNGNPSDNRLSNLRYDTAKGNSQDRKKHGTQVYPKGEMQGGHKLKTSDVKQIIALYQKGYTQKELADKFGVCFQNISQIVNRKTWKHI